MFTLYNSNKLDMLKSILVDLIKNKQLIDPLCPEIILVQNNYITQWIQIQLASQLGIAMNIKFLNISDFIWQIFNIFLPNIPKKNNFSKQTMVWQLISLIPKISQYSECEYINEYLKNDLNKLKCFKLSKLMANVFDQYLIYRPDWLEAWQNNSKINNLGQAQQWQASLWRALLKQINQSGQSTWHYAKIYKHFMQKIKQIKKLPINIPHRIFIFNISILPPIYLHMLSAISQYIDIHLLFINPCKHYWEDICNYNNFGNSIKYSHDQQKKWINKPDRLKSELFFNSFDEYDNQKMNNPLLASWGKQGQENLCLLNYITEIIEVNAFVKPNTNNLLNILQNDILNLEDHSVGDFSNKKLNYKRILHLDDNSFSIHICYSIQREVEVLYDRILTIMSKDHTLEPRDIIVIAIDIEQYVPAIQAVFNKIDIEYYIPYSISDIRIKLNSLLTAFIKLLELPCVRFSSEDVLSLLEVPSIAKRFAIKEQELQLISKWISTAGICWDSDNNALCGSIININNQHTWQFGITRMLLGYAMDSKSGCWQNIWPNNEFNGLTTTLIGNLAEFLTKLNYWRSNLYHPRHLKDWLIIVQEIIDDFFISYNKETDEAIKLLKNKWQQIINEGIQIKYNQLISITLLKNELFNNLNQDNVKNYFSIDKINFCTLESMQSIPFKVVYILGMNNYDSYHTENFNLMTQQSRIGDLNKQDKDKYLFLKTLLSAEQQLYISFIGYNIQNNTIVHPSSLVNELINYITKSFYLVGDELLDIKSSEERVYEHICQSHSSMPFAKENFMPGKNQSFAEEWLSVIKSKHTSSKDFFCSLKEEYSKQLSLNELIFFYSHPIRYWFQKRLKIYLHQNSVDLPLNEPFYIKNKIQFKIANQLVSAILDKKSTEHLYHQVMSDGLLPYGEFGKLCWAKSHQAMATFAEKIRIWYQMDFNNIEIFLKLDQITLSGWLKVQANGLLLRWNPGALSLQDGLLLWIDHLAYCAMGFNGESRLFGLFSEWHFKSLSANQAKELLFSIIHGYYQGLASPLLLFNNLGKAWLNKCFDMKNKTINQDKNVQKKARDHLIIAWYKARDGKNADIYLQKLIQHLDENYIIKIISAIQDYFLPPLIFNNTDYDFKK